MNNIEKHELELPKLFFHGKFFHNELKRLNIIFLSVIYVYYSYFYASMLEMPALINGSGVIVTVFGLLLTLKHNFIDYSNDKRGAYDSYYGTANLIDSHDDLNNPIYMEPVFNAIRDEYWGVILIFIGSVIGAYGGLVPLIVATT